MKRKDNRNTFTVSDPTLILQALVSLKDTRVLEYRRDRAVQYLRVWQIVKDPLCPGCGGRAWVKDRVEVSYIDLPVYGKPMRLVWRKHRFWCPRLDCQKKSWVGTDPMTLARTLTATSR
ncbi:transposase family protein [Scrofimicrobium canadense]|uniref:transposase family protein n=1 Tax=Scrofimicrobium canadense TaxID=2652290 RepID=UPI0012B3739C|nr:transposase family protein [Scrofimicrobium canadense]